MLKEKKTTIYTNHSTWYCRLN